MVEVKVRNVEGGEPRPLERAEAVRRILLEDVVAVGWEPTLAEQREEAPAVFRSLEESRGVLADVEWLARPRVQRIYGRLLSIVETANVGGEAA